MQQRIISPDMIEEKSGLEVLRLMRDYALPGPTMASTLNFTLTRVEAGVAVFEGEPTDEMLNPFGTAHGGWAATILDSALACAVHTTLLPGDRHTSVEMKVSFLRPIHPGKTGRLTCEGRIINRGRTLALSEATLVDEDGKLYAHGTETCMIFPKKD